MTLNIDLNPDKEAVLRDAASRRGMPIEQYVKTVLEENLTATGSVSRLTQQEEERFLDELAELGRNIPVSPTGETYSRTTIYVGRD
jgi:hypothetical protein